jgi:NAD(P)-dependent dehydrogenase (short-subunit alcohol dehydrogenase family)
MWGPRAPPAEAAERVRLRGAKRRVQVPAKRGPQAVPVKPPLWDRLDGQTALVSGATRGLGAAVTAALFDLGATVFAGARNPKDLQGVRDTTAGKVVPVKLDVQHEEDCAAAVRAAVQATGRLDLLVNNAGIGDFRGRTLGTLETEKLDEVLATNLRGPMLLAREALPHLLARPGGRVVNVSSGMGALTEGMGTGSPAYRVSKTALNGLTAYLHAEYGPRGLLANSACPGWVRTDMGGPEAPRSVAEGIDGIVWLCRFKPGAPAGRFWRDRHEIAW